MTILLVLVPISLLLFGLAVAAFVWATRRGQFDDLQTPALDILGDDRAPGRVRRRSGHDRAPRTSAASETGAAAADEQGKTAPAPRADLGHADAD